MAELETRVGVLLPGFEKCGVMTTSQGAGRAADVYLSVTWSKDHR
jgi:hypothetical protein